MKLDVAIAALCLAGLWLLYALHALRATPRPPEADRESRQRALSPPADLARIQRVVELSIDSASDLHVRLRPLLREVAAARLGRRGLDLDGGGAAVLDLLGDDGWELLRPDRERPERSFATGGISPARLAAIIERLEAL